MLSDFYKYSIFSNMSYVIWNDENSGANSSFANLMSAAANEAERLPDNPGAANTTLGEEIFVNQGWTIPSFYPTDDTGFAANVFTNGDEKILAIRGTDEFFEDFLKSASMEAWQYSGREGKRYS